MNEEEEIEEGVRPRKTGTILTWKDIQDNKRRKMNQERAEEEKVFDPEEEARELGLPGY